MTINILQLPVDILVTVLKKLNLSNLRNVILTCKTFKNLVLNDNTIWRSVCRDRLILNKTTDRHSNELSWYNRCRISMNWCNGIYKNKLLMRFSTNYMPWLKLHDSEYLLVSKGSELNCFFVNRRGRIKCYNPLWTIHVPTVKRNDVRTNDISRFVIENDVLVCGNRDGSTAIYTVDNIKVKPKLICHIQDSLTNGDVEVSTVEIIPNKNDYYIITASSYYPHMVFWNYTRSNIVDTVMDIPIDDGDGVRCVALDSDRNKLAVGLDGNSKPLLLDVNIFEAMTASLVVLSDSKAHLSNSKISLSFRWRKTLCGDHSLLVACPAWVATIPKLDNLSPNNYRRFRHITLKPVPPRLSMFTILEHIVNIRGKFLMTANETRHWNEAIRDIIWHDENTIAYVTHSGKLNIIDVRTHLLVYEANDPFRSTLYCLKSDRNNALLVGSSEYSRCVLFDKRNNRHHTQLYFTHRRASPVYCLDFDSSRLLTGVDEGIVALDFNINPTYTQQRDYSYVFY